MALVLFVNLIIFLELDSGSPRPLRQPIIVGSRISDQIPVERQLPAPLQPLRQFKTNSSYEEMMQKSQSLSISGLPSKSSPISKTAVPVPDLKPDPVWNNSSFGPSDVSVQEELSTRYADMKIIKPMILVESGGRKYTVDLP